MINVVRWSTLVNRFLPGHQRVRLFPVILGIIEVESSGNPGVTGGDGEIGLMQVHPKWHLKPGEKAEDLRPPAVNLERGISYLRSLFARFNGQIDYAIAAYNYGPGRIEIGKPIPNQSYVDRVKAAAARYQGDLSRVLGIDSASLPMIIFGSIISMVLLWAIFSD
jgi:hypothetical protein